MPTIVITGRAGASQAEIDAVQAVMRQFIEMAAALPLDLALNGLLGAALNLAESHGITAQVADQMARMATLIASHVDSRGERPPVH